MRHIENLWRCESIHVDNPGYSSDIFPAPYNNRSKIIWRLMGAALCTCGGPDDQGLNSLSYDRLGGHKTGRVGTIVNQYSTFSPKFEHVQHPDHSSLLLRRKETYELSDETQDKISDDAYGGGYSSARAYADAFRAKLQEPPLSPRSKFKLLSSRFAADESVTPTESSRDSGSNDEETVEGVTTASAVAKRRKCRQQAWNSYAFPDETDEVKSMDEDKSVTEEEWKQRANPVITIIVPPGPCGLVLQVDEEDSGAPIVDGFVRKYDGRKSPIENSGLVKRGSILCAINDIDVTRMSLKEVIRTLNSSSHLERTFTFRNGFQYHRNSMC